MPKTEFIIEDDRGNTHGWSYSMEPEHLVLLDNFLHDDLGVSYVDVMRQGGLETLVGRTFEVMVEYFDKDSLTISPVPKIFTKY